MPYYIPNLFVTVPLVLRVKSACPGSEGNVSGLCRQGSEGLVHFPGALATTGAGQLVNKGVWAFHIHSHPMDIRGGLSHQGRRWPLSSAEGMACVSSILFLLPACGLDPLFL